MRKIHFLFQLFIFVFLISCGTSKSPKGSQRTFDEQSHRGGRGLIPENTIASQKNAIDYNTTLEMDLQMSKDKKIVVSHDAYFSAAFSLTPEGREMTPQDGRSRLLFNMNYDSIKKYDVGLKPHPDFPEQKKMPAYKPLLNVLIDSVEDYAKKKNHINHYNIELKTSPQSDGVTYPSLDEYVDSAMHIIISKGIAPRTMIQSFDVRALRIVHTKYPGIKISFLVSASNKKDAGGYIAELGFKPDIFSPEFSLVTASLVKQFHEQHILVIPWTPDTLEDIQRLKDMGADGAITDYPNLYSQIK